MRKLAMMTAMLAGAACAAEPGEGLPHAQPVTATAIVICSFGKQEILTMIVSYPDGSVVRFKANDMHGFTVPQMMAYASQAKDTYSIGQQCGTET